MLNHITIRNFAIVDELSLDLKPAMSVLTGETGAGKSILIDALGLALGDRADTSMIRSGCKHAEVTAQFDLQEHVSIKDRLQEQALDEGDDCLIRRVLSRDSRSRAFINGRPVTLQQVEQLGKLLVAIHGQNAHQLLLQRSHQRQLLDAYGGHLRLAKGGG